jgi:hypothetical protein
LLGLGPINFFLGIEAILVYEGLFLTHCQYVTDLLKRSNMSLAKPAITPREAANFWPLLEMRYPIQHYIEALLADFNMCPSLVQISLLQGTKFTNLCTILLFLIGKLSREYDSILRELYHVAFFYEGFLFFFLFLIINVNIIEKA